MATVNQKIRLLVGACALIVALLCYIQYRLVRNTYELTRDQYISEVKSSVNATIAPVSNQLNTAAMAELRQVLAAYLEGKTGKKEMIASLKSRKDSANAKRNRQLERSLQSQALLKDLRYQMVYTGIVLTCGGKADTLLSENAGPLPLTSRPFDISEAYRLNQGIQISQLESPGCSISVSYADYVQIGPWRTAVLKRMGTVLLQATGLILAIVVLFYWAIRTLIRQKKIADLQTDFANNVTHELKTPLASIELIVQSLKNPGLRNNPNTFEDLIGALERQQMRLRHIVESVLDSTNEQQVKLAPMAINTFLGELLGQYRFGNRALHWQLDNSNAIVNIHPGSLETALRNLLDNAFKYSADDKPVQLYAGKAEDVFLISIADQGPGIPDKEIPRIFRKFYRIPTGDRHDVKGLGLGLYLAHRAVLKMNGQLSVASSGKGTVFTLKLPLV